MKFFIISFKNSFAYRAAAVFAIISSVISVAIQICLWSYLYKEDPEMIAYMTKYVIFSKIVSMCYISSIAEVLQEKISKGTFAIDLIKPVNIFFELWGIELGHMSAGLLLKAVPLLVFYFPILISCNGQYNFWGFGVALILGHILFFLLYALIGQLSFVLIEIWPMKRFLDDTIRLLAGSLVPLSILPSSIRNFAELLPFKYFYFFPIEILMNEAKRAQIQKGLVILLLWILLFSLLNYIVYKRNVRKLVVQGG